MTLRERLKIYFQKHPNIWIASGSIQRLVVDKTSYTPSNASRRLRELENDNFLEVKYEKGHAFYRLKQKVQHTMFQMR